MPDTPELKQFIRMKQQSDDLRTVRINPAVSPASTGVIILEEAIAEPGIHHPFDVNIRFAFRFFNQPEAKAHHINQRSGNAIVS